MRSSMYLTGRPQMRASAAQDADLVGEQLAAEAAAGDHRTN